MTVLLSALQGLLLGAVIGAAFALCRLQPPAPATLAGVAAIVGLWLGWSTLSR